MSDVFDLLAVTAGGFLVLLGSAALIRRWQSQGVLRVLGEFGPAEQPRDGD